VGIALNVVFWRDPLKPVDVFLILIIGFVAGIIWSFARRIPRLVAALEADRQFELNDLFSTASSFGSATEDAWPRCVVALADQKARELSERKITVGYLSARSWTLVALGMVLAVTLALFSSARQRDMASSLDRTVGQQRNPALTSATGQRIRPPGQSPADADGQRSFSGDFPIPPAAVSNGVSNTGAGSRSESQAKGDGAGLATTPAKVQSHGEEPSPNRSSEISGTSAQVAGGVGPNGSGNPGPSQADGIVSQSGGSNAAPWQSTQWPAEQTRSLQAIQTHKIDPAYADLVRDYFQHP